MKRWRGYSLWMVVLGALLILGIVLDRIGLLNPAEGGVFRVFEPVQSAFVGIGEGVSDLVQTARDLRDLRQRNQQLVELVNQLAVENVRLKEVEAENEILRRLLDFAQSSPGHTFKAAEVRTRVVGRQPDNISQFILIAAGSNDGIQAGMPVVTERGLVGRVETVYPTLSKVRLIIDTSSAVSALVQRTRATGVVKGRPGGELVLDYLPQGQDVVAVGDVVLTSGAGGGFPRQLVIGQVIEIRQKDYEMFQQAILRPTVDFDRLEVVLIITNFVPLGLEGLEPAPGTAGP
ncbi:MAG: rod shape-determining protein MreC [Anaerolineae bacterium]|nr:rod shape-determining protein MreC [Anaerolineae bacterium]